MDSFYEYALKSHVLFDDASSLQLFNSAYSAALKSLKIGPWCENFLKFWRHRSTHARATAIASCFRFNCFLKKYKQIKVRIVDHWNSISTGFRFRFYTDEENARFLFTDSKENGADSSGVWYCRAHEFVERLQPAPLHPLFPSCPLALFSPFPKAPSSSPSRLVDRLVRRGRLLLRLSG